MRPLAVLRRVVPIHLGRNSGVDETLYRVAAFSQTSASPCRDVDAWAPSVAVAILPRSCPTPHSSCSKKARGAGPLARCPERSFAQQGFSHPPQPRNSGHAPSRSPPTRSDLMGSKYMGTQRSPMFEPKSTMLEPISAKAGRLRESLADIVQIWLRLSKGGHLCRTTAELDRNSTGFDRSLTEFDQSWTEFDRIRTVLSQAQVARMLSNFGHICVQIRPNSDNCGPKLSRFGRNRPNLDRR